MLWGFGGGDLLFGGAGNDTLDGGSGADIMQGETGNDIYLVDHDADLVIELSVPGTDTIETSVHTTSLNQSGRFYVENLDLNGPGAVKGVGNSLGNRIYGNFMNNVLSGRGGDDHLYGSDGNDTLDGESGNDLLRGEDDRDTLNGGSGNDILHGGLGLDTITTGSGFNSVLFSEGTMGISNFDRILDFSPLYDTIRLDKSAFQGLALGVLPHDAFHVGAAATDAEDRIICNPATGNLYFDRDGTGSAYGQYLFADLAAGLAMTNLDFLVV